MNTTLAIMIGNDGGLITSTNYWQTEHAAKGLFFVSINAGTVRLLVPPSQEATIREMKTARKVVLTRGIHDGRDAVEILFDDRTSNPFVLFLDVQQFDRVWPPTDDGRKFAFTIYTESKGRIWSDDCYVRRTKNLPYLKPWTN